MKSSTNGTEICLKWPEVFECLEKMGCQQAIPNDVQSCKTQFDKSVAPNCKKSDACKESLAASVVPALVALTAAARLLVL
eukprot:m51a1_g11531 putative C-tail anchored protein (80) ;mRNA; f:9947-10186